MQSVTPAIKASLGSSSWIRRMFEKGLELKRLHGEENVCDFSLGNPDVPPPKETVDVLMRIAASASSPLALGYCPNAGIAPAREALARHLSVEQKTKIAPSDVIVSTGAAGALVSFFRAVIEEGDEVITPAPYFVEYGAYVGHFGGILKAVDSIAPSFEPDVDAIAAAITPKTRAIIINSPNNPTGAVYSLETLTALSSVVEKVNESRQRPLFLLFDEPYRAFAYDGIEVPAALPLTRYACIFGSFSKTLSLAGERIGYCLVHPDMPDGSTLLQALTLTTRTLGFVNAPVIGQKIVSELAGTTVDLEIYDRRRKAMAKVLSEAGIEFAMPRGAFYFFAKSPVEDDSVFVDELLKENILVVPGRGFGYGGYVRLSCCVDEKIILRSADGFKRVMERILK